MTYADLEARFDGPIPPQLRTAVLVGVQRHRINVACGNVAVFEDLMRGTLRTLRAAKRQGANADRLALLRADYRDYWAERRKALARLRELGDG